MFWKLPYAMYYNYTIYHIPNILYHILDTTFRPLVFWKLPLFTSAPFRHLASSASTEVGFPICDGADPRQWPDELEVWQAQLGPKKATWKDPKMV